VHPQYGSGLFFTEDAALSTQPAPSAPEVDYTAEEVDDVIDAATQRGTRHVPIECIEQMRKVLHAALSAPFEQVAASVLDSDDWAVLRRLKDALPDVGLNGWYRGVTVLGKLLAAAPVAPERATCEGREA
jgi:hypothetical protein